MEFVRVKHIPTGNEFTTTDSAAAADSDLVRVKADATDMAGQPLPPTYPKPRVPLGERTTTPKE